MSHKVRVLLKLIAPNGLKGESNADGRVVSLTWTDNSNHETEILVERSVDNSKFSSCGIVGQNQTSFSDSTVEPGNTYSYRVKARNATASSDYSSVITVSTPNPTPSTPPTPPTRLTGSTDPNESVVYLSWTDQSEDETQFVVERAPEGGAFIQLGVADVNKTAFADITVIAGISYNYRIKAINEAGSSGYSDSVQVSTLFGPTELSGAPALDGKAIYLHWKDNSQHESEFVVEQAVGDGPFTRSFKVGANADGCGDGAVNVGNSYTYRVKAINSAGSSAYSNPVTIHTPSVPTTPVMWAASNGSTEGIVFLGWYDVYDNESGFEIQRSLEGGSFKTLANTDANITAFADITAIPGGNYVYRIAAINGSSPRFAPRVRTCYNTGSYESKLTLSCVWSSRRL